MRVELFRVRVKRDFKRSNVRTLNIWKVYIIIFYKKPIYKKQEARTSKIKELLGTAL